MRKYIMLCCLLSVWFTDSMAQKRPLDMEAYKLWRRVEAQQMSNDDLGRRTDYIIENSGDIEELKLRAAAVAKDILGRFLKTR